MKGLSAGVKIGILFLLMTGGGYAVWKNLGQDPSGKGAYPLHARFRDASGLPVGAKVVVAGLPVGQITKLSVDGRYAQVHFKVRRDVQVWSNATVIKKAKSLLGDNYLEIDPGGPESMTAEGTKEINTLLTADGEVTHIVEATTPDQLMRRIEETLPNIDNVLLSVKDLSEDVRRIVNGPLASVATRVDSLVERESGTVSDILARADSSIRRIDSITQDIKQVTGGADVRVNKILENLDAASAEAKGLVATAKSELEQTGASVRDKLDHLDDVIDNTRSITSKVDGETGTLGKLVNDPAIANNVEDITEDAKGFLGSLFNIKTYVGLRSEYNIFAGVTRNYISVEIHTRPDKFYLLELEKGPRGGYPDTSLTYDPTVDPNYFIRKSVIEDKIRFTFQFAKRFDWLTLRFGLKESTGGVGADADFRWWDRDVKLSVDGFDATFDALPRVKIAVALELFRGLYVLGGVDEALNNPANLPILSGTSDVPVQFESFRYGRDYFLGGMLKFNDEDLASLLYVGGSALSGATK